MRPFLFLLMIFVWSGTCSLQAKQLPLTASEIGLMLRGGYSCASVLRELSARHFAGTLDAAKEEALVKAGASAELISALKSGAYAVPALEAARTQEQLANQAQRKALAAEEARKSEAAYREQLDKDRAIAKGEAVNATRVYDLLRDDLVHIKDGKLAPAEDATLASKKWFLIYYAAKWGEKGQNFTPRLVDYYNRVRWQHPEFEVIFYSFDKSVAQMEIFMTETGMPWPAIDFAKRNVHQEILKMASSAVPDLILIDNLGHVISQDYKGREYLGTAHVLADLDTLLGGGKVEGIAQTK